MPAKNKYVIEGQVKTMQAADFARTPMTVHAFVGGREVAKAKVDKKGQYSLRFEHAGDPPVTEVRLLPANLSGRAAQALSLKKTMTAYRYVETDRGLAARYDLMIPADFLLLIQTITKTYRLHGAVYATTFAADGVTPISIEPLPAAKIEFYEVDAPFLILPGMPPTLSEAYLGQAYTAPDGSYEFLFDFSYKHNPWMVFVWLFQDRKPDIRARISQFEDGIWQQIYEGPVDWDIVEDFHRDYFIPAEDVIPIPDSGVKPAEGFRFTSVGLLPIDATRLVKGYATSQPGDPVNLTHQPLCGTLRIFGLFAEAPPVTTYKVQIADADEDGPTGSWRDVTDPLHNREWNHTLHVWEHRVLGPDPVTAHYQNIDTQAEADWHEHALKATWNSVNEPNGYYALRIIGYDEHGAAVVTREMPVMRIDNTAPEIDFEPLGAVTACGHLALPASRKIQFRVTAFDPEGHMFSYNISGTRGKAASPAGAPVGQVRPTPIWTGIKNATQEFIVDVRPAALSGCTTLAYNFELHIWGSATNCYSTRVGAQHRKRETNLVVSE
ncbi:MAG: hypothetical protein JXB35_14285 [Anaerolineae bacterium]|nr:hypothetical protein [Anaerolineae bacterium]